MMTVGDITGQKKKDIEHPFLEILACISVAILIMGIASIIFNAPSWAVYITGYFTIVSTRLEYKLSRLSRKEKVY